MSVTQHRRLFAGRPLWLGSRPALPCRRPPRSEEVDVAVIGAGITGAFMARALAGRYARVRVIDRRRPIDGSTLASTSLLQFEIDQPLILLADRIGWADARRAWRRSHRATGALIDLVRRHRLDCGYEPRRTLYLAGDVLGRRALEREAAARGRAGLPGQFIDRETLAARYGIDRTGAIESSGSAVADPARLAAALLRDATRRGARIRCPAEVRDVRVSPGRVVLDLGRAEVRCRHAIFCTGYELLHGVPRNDAQVATTWAIASRPAARRPAWLDRTLVWEASDPYLYIRSTPDGRVIVGGADEPAIGSGSAKRRLPAKARALIRAAEALIPGLVVHPSHRWTGPFGETATGLPIIDRVPGMPGCYAVMGFGGNGITYAMIAAQVVSALIAGAGDPDAHLYRFDR